MAEVDVYTVKPIGFVRSELRDRGHAPMQGYEGAPEAWIDVVEDARDGLLGIAADQEVILLTWLHQANRDALQIHPRSDPARPLSGVFATRSPDRPNPIGLHRVTVLEVDDGRLRVAPLEAIDGTPVVDIKPVLAASVDE